MGASFVCDSGSINVKKVVEGRKKKPRRLPVCSKGQDKNDDVQDHKEDETAVVDYVGKSSPSLRCVHQQCNICREPKLGPRKTNRLPWRRVQPASSKATSPFSRQVIPK